MKIIRKVSEMRAEADRWRHAGLRVGFVPTMGYLHEGHLSLVRIAAQQSDRTVVSIFVNPTQFGPGEDLDRYPRDFDRDRQLCARNGVSAIFYPEVDEMYLPDASTRVVEDALSKPLCGRSRPTHFCGVTTVVAKLFHAVGPCVAVFGQKDAQQALVIRRMVRDLNFPVQVVVAPVVREADGLAMSSRNKYLSADERQRALSIHRGLCTAVSLYEGGERASSALCGAVRNAIGEAQGRIDYVELVDREHLQPVAHVEQPCLLAVAAFFGATRLIDNRFLG